MTKTRIFTHDPPLDACEKAYANISTLESQYLENGKTKQDAVGDGRLRS